MKKSNIQIRKLTKKELKEINGGNETDCLNECFCFVTGPGEPYIGSCNAKGACC
ncbi:bacteriocin-like protein [Chryseobacterium sp. H1D6B]|uniref:bacteriocin n=1 Tax=Chryseobacterium sp. H1D6B TaxID=2940588 RepID=UPI0015CA20DE|nr:bacteriocin [Chryseobacterium sp. H1D6B]MDH6251674.1 bacteriocin-like protein [Chryseobacterium sp. H1D6B]